MLPTTPPELGTGEAAAPEANPLKLTSPRRGFASLAARILGVAIALVSSTILSVGLSDLNSFTLTLVAIGVLAMLAAILLHSWWALLIVPLANTIGFCGTGLGFFLFEAASHGGPDIRDPGQLVGGLLVAVLIWGVLPALIGALVGTLLWHGWVTWRSSQTTRQGP